MRRRWEFKTAKARFATTPSLEEAVASLLSEGWEPFAFDQHEYAVLLRREVETF